jgi:hypothetical protein
METESVSECPEVKMVGKASEAAVDRPSNDEAELRACVSALVLASLSPEEGGFEDKHSESASLRDLASQQVSALIRDLAS